VKGVSATLHVSDLYELNHNHKSEVLAPQFSSIVNAPMLSRLFGFFKYDLLRQGGWATVNSVAVFVPPILIRFIIEYLEAP
jgi:hypothetical protein